MSAKRLMLVLHAWARECALPPARAASRACTRALAWDTPARAHHVAGHKCFTSNPRTSRPRMNSPKTRPRPHISSPRSALLQRAQRHCPQPSKRGAALVERISARRSNVTLTSRATLCEVFAQSRKRAVSGGHARGPCTWRGCWRGGRDVRMRTTPTTGPQFTQPCCHPAHPRAPHQAPSIQHPAPRPKIQSSHPHSTTFHTHEQSSLTRYLVDILRGVIKPL